MITRLKRSIELIRIRYSLWTVRKQLDRLADEHQHEIWFCREELQLFDVYAALLQRQQELKKPKNDDYRKSHQ